MFLKLLSLGKQCHIMLMGETEKFLQLFSLIPLYTNVNKILLGSMKSNQLTLKEINHEYSFEGLMLKLKLQ